MTMNVTYPGVYVQEIPSGVRTITGVATSITAFVGRAPTGPVNEPVSIASWGDYQNTFGGLSLSSTMSYAVNDFFQNGGSQAVIVRLYQAPTSGSSSSSSSSSSSTAPAGTAFFAVPQGVGSSSSSSSSSSSPWPGLTLAAASPGSWGNTLPQGGGLTVTADTNGIPSNTDVAAIFGPGLTQADLFNLTVFDGGTQVERFLNLSLVDGPRRIDRVLAQSSQYLAAYGVPTSPASGLGAQVASAIARCGGTVTTVVSGGSVTTVVNGHGFTGGVDSATLSDTTYLGDGATTGIYSLQNTDLFNLLCIPPDTRAGDTSANVLGAALAYCVTRRAVLIVDPPAEWGNAAAAQNGLGSLNLTGVPARNAAIYFPRVIEADPLRQGQTDTFPPCGIVAGLFAATDAQRGVWKAPAGVDVALQGIQGLATRLADSDSGALNPLGINCLRTFPVIGSVIWGARTLRGADQLADDYKYIPVRRLALYIEQSLVQGLQWVVFEPNDTPLWAQIRQNAGAFMNNLFKKGAFQGASPNDAYFVKCDSETTTQTDINNGVVNVIVGFAPLKPAEFVVISIQQMAGQIAT